MPSSGRISALCQRQLLQYEAAAGSLRRSLALRPQSAETLNALASVLRSQGREADAKAAFEQVLAIDPNHVAANVNLAKALSEERRLAEAESHLARAVGSLRSSEAGISKETVDLWGVIAKVFANLAQYAGANRIYKAICAFGLTPERAVAAVLPARRVCDRNFAASVEPFVCQVARTQPDQISAGFATLLYLPGTRPRISLRRRAVMRIRSPPAEPFRFGTT